MEDEYSIKARKFEEIVSEKNSEIQALLLQICDVFQVCQLQSGNIVKAPRFLTRDHEVSEIAQLGDCSI